ncbi:MAG: BrnT family toxin, partial [Terracidiphilus sp.]
VMPEFEFPATITHVEITYDPRKSERTLRERNLGFDEAEKFDFASASYFGEVRRGEHRLVAVGYLRGRLHVLCFLPKERGIRVISFRKANDREARKYGMLKTFDE